MSFWGTLGTLGSLAVTGINAAAQRGNYLINRENQQKTWDREDNAIQRRTADMRAAGINPILAAGNPAAASPATLKEAPQIDVEPMLAKAQIEQAKAQTAYTNAQTELAHFNAETARIQAEASTTGADTGRMAENRLQELHEGVKSELQHRIDIQGIGRTLLEQESELNRYNLRAEYVQDQIRAQLALEGLTQERNRSRISDHEANIQQIQVQVQEILLELARHDRDIITRQQLMTSGAMNTSGVAVPAGVGIGVADLINDITNTVTGTANRIRSGISNTIDNVRSRFGR